MAREQATELRGRAEQLRTRGEAAVGDLRTRGEAAVEDLRLRGEAAVEAAKTPKGGRSNDGGDKKKS
jgi:hypothetical protein